MPSIEGMANIITVCLGRNVRFNLVIQAYAQLKISMVRMQIRLMETVGIQFTF